MSHLEGKDGCVVESVQLHLCAKQNGNHLAEIASDYLLLQDIRN